MERDPTYASVLAEHQKKWRQSPAGKASAQKAEIKRRAVRANDEQYKEWQRAHTQKPEVKQRRRELNRKRAADRALALLILPIDAPPET